MHYGIYSAVLYAIAQNLPVIKFPTKPVYNRIVLAEVYTFWVCQFCIINFITRFYWMLFHTTFATHLIISAYS